MSIIVTKNEPGLNITKQLLIIKKRKADYIPQLKGPNRKETAVSVFFMGEYL